MKTLREAKQALETQFEQLLKEKESTKQKAVFEAAMKEGSFKEVQQELEEKQGEIESLKDEISALQSEVR